MSYIPLRDRFRFEPAVNARIVDLAVSVEEEAERDYHRDECRCADPECGIGLGYNPGAPEVIAYLIERGAFHADVLADLTKEG